MNCIVMKDPSIHYILKDHQGNLTATVCGNTMERLWHNNNKRRLHESFL